jgi:hypothetical protein
VGNGQLARTDCIADQMKRWPIIRHIRYFYWTRQADKWFLTWHEDGYYYPVHQHLDQEYLDEIWRGER